MIVNNLNVVIDGKKILDDVSFKLNNHDKVGLIGENGSGKSTLLKTLINDDIAYLNQEISHEFDNMSILEFIKKEIKLDVLENKLHELENNLNDLELYSEVLNKFLELDGYCIENNLLNIMNGLNLNKDLETKIKILSGGEKIKVLLCALILKNKPILFLDEPTNNLDLDAINWLENFLIKSKKKMIIVSHDEVFLNNIVNKIFELKDGKIKEYNVGYNDYLIIKDKEYNNSLETHKKLLEERDSLKKKLEQSKKWVNKGSNKKSSDNDKIAFKYSKEKTNNTNISKYSKALENLNIPNFKEKEKIKFDFNYIDDKGNKDIILDNLICGYEDFKLSDINLKIPFGSRVLIKGPNGSGKSTLLKTLINEIPPIKGKVIMGSHVKIGYISQDTYHSNKTILEYLDISGKYDKSTIFTILDKFNISYDDKNKLYNTLSCGQRTRVNLAKLGLDKINILILDEVTNHLDKEAIDLLEEIITNFRGTIICVSHNRKFIEILNPDTILEI